MESRRDCPRSTNSPPTIMEGRTGSPSSRDTSRIIMESHRDSPRPTASSSIMMESRRDCPRPRLGTGSDSSAPVMAANNSRVSSGDSSETVIIRVADRNDESTLGDAQDCSRASQPASHGSIPGLAISARSSSAPSPTVHTESPGSVTRGPAPAYSSDSVSIRHFRPSTSGSSEDMPIRNAGVFRGTRFSPSPESAESRAVRTPTVATHSSTDFSFTTLYPISSEDDEEPAEERPRSNRLRLARGREQVINYLATASSSTRLTSFEEGMGIPRPSSPSDSTTSGGGGGTTLKELWWTAFWILLVLNIAMTPVYILFLKYFLGIR